MHTGFVVCRSFPTCFIALVLPNCHCYISDKVSAFLESVQLVQVRCVLYRVYLRNPLDPPDISGFGKDQNMHSNKDKRKCSICYLTVSGEAVVFGFDLCTYISCVFRSLFGTI